MRSVTVRLDDLRTMILNLGFVGENEHRTFNFDCKKMFGEYPSASVSLAVQPPAGDCYPATVERNGDLVSWTVSDSDLIEEGCGEIQLTFMVGDVKAKTCVGRTKVERSLEAMGDIPTPIENWIERAEEVISEAEAATAAAEDAAEHQPIIDDNGYWAVWDADAEEYAATEYKAQGTDGHDGVGIVSIEKTGTSGLVDTYTITFTSGNPVTYTVTNGRDADPAALIDDASTAQNRTWSAKKLDEEKSSLLTEINSKADKTVTDVLQKDKAPVIIDHAEGNPIVLTDGAEGLPVEGMKIHFFPVQDLHGYDSPWPGGGGKNKANFDEIQIGKAWNTGNNVERATLFVPALPSTEYTVSITGFDGLTLTYAEKSDAASTSSLYLTTFVSGLFTRVTTDSTRCIVIQFAKTGGISAADLANTKVQLELGSIATAFAPYSNICPIEGWTGLTAWRTDVNMFDPANPLTVGTREWRVDANGYIMYNGTTDGRSYKYSNCQYFLYLKAGTYYIFGESTDVPLTGSTFKVILPDDTNVKTVDITNKSTVETSFTLSADSEVGILVKIINEDASYPHNYRFVLSMEEADAYTPYAGDSYPVTFPEIIYGGTPDVVNGVLKVEWAKFVATSSAIRRNDGNRWYIPNMYTNSIIPQADTANAVISNVFKSATGGQYDDKCFINSSGAIRFNTSAEYESIDALMSAIPEMEFVFLLATPIEIPLDPITIQTLLGDNTIWSDANGTIELDYRADTKLFIAKNKQDIRATIAPIEDGATASKAYSAGKYFYHNGNFCKAKTSIASGATFTLNTNYEITTVADELFALN